MVRKRGDRCMVEGCGRSVYCSQLCLRCYHRVRYWLNKRSVRKVVSRVHDLQVWLASMEMLVSQRSGRKVVSIKRRRKKAA